jgi:hypothetical protein
MLAELDPVGRYHAIYLASLEHAFTPEELIFRKRCSSIEIA